MEENVELTPQSPGFPTGKRELTMLAVMILMGIFLVNTALYYGLNLGFAIAAVLCIGTSALYLLCSGCKLTFYSGSLLLLSMVCAASFVRSDDAFVKFVMFCFYLLGGNLSLCLLAGQNRRSAAGVTSLLDVPRTVFVFGFGSLHDSTGGLKASVKNGGAAGKNRAAVLLGLVIAVPVLAILIPLLIRADAAFEGLISLLPEFKLTEWIGSLVFGVPLAAVIYTRNAALKHKEKAEPALWRSKAVHPMTVNTVLVAVCLVYCAYLLSQLAYFVGGFAGLLPEGYTMAEYARRGFFEMAWLSFLNLGIMTVSIALVALKNDRAPLFTRILCLFIGILSLFFVGTASAKMLQYISSYGLTRLRLLTEVIMVFIAVTVVYVTVWLFAPKFPYMKAVIFSALLIGASVAWADVDTVVAAYNVNAYQSGRLESIDISHLSGLGDGAVPHVQKLTQEKNLTLRTEAQEALSRWSKMQNKDLRAWNIASGQAEVILEQYNQPEEAEPIAEKLKTLVYYGDITEAARILHSCRLEYPVQEDILQLTVKDGALWLENGEMLEPLFSYDAIWHVTEAQISSIWVGEDYVLLWPADTDRYCLLWSESPDSALELLWEEYPHMEPEHLIDQWYYLSMQGETP